MNASQLTPRSRRGRIIAAIAVVVCIAMLAAAARATGWATTMTSVFDRLMPGPATTMWAATPEPDAYAESYADATGAGTNYVYKVDAATAEGTRRTLAIISFGGKASGEGYLEIEAKGGTGAYYEGVEEGDVPQEALAALGEA